MHNYHRVWAEVNLDAIRANMESFRDNVPKEAMLCGVIKTDGYGLGAVPVAKTIDDLVWGYAVATIDEALNLRRHNITKPIMFIRNALQIWLIIKFVMPVLRKIR